MPGLRNPESSPRLRLFSTGSRDILKVGYIYVQFVTYVWYFLDPKVAVIIISVVINFNKKLSYCWETVRRESMPRIAEMDVEMIT